MSQKHNGGGGIWAWIKLILLLMFAFVLHRTDAHLDEKYQHSPPAGDTHEPTADSVR